VIVELIINIFVSLISFIGSLFPEMETPGWLSDLAGLVGTVSSQMAGLGAWVPFGAAGTATLVVLSALAVALLVKLVRVCLSLLTGGGGGAA
jgi:hypothetical protein